MTRAPKDSPLPCLYAKSSQTFLSTFTSMQFVLAVTLKATYESVKVYLEKMST